MKKHPLTLAALCLGGLLIFAACGQIAQNPTPAPPSPTPVPPTSTITSTPDPCAPQNLPAHVHEMHRLMREFDDAFAIAGNTERENLTAPIVELQRLRREAEDQVVPSCLKALKEVQLVHMNTVIQTMLGFKGGAEQDSVNQGIALARQLHNQYMIEMSRLLGSTVVAVPTNPIASEGTPDPASGETPEPTSSVPVVTNPGPTGVKMRAQPSLESQTMSMLAVGQSALALGISPDSFWIMIEIPGQPGQMAWVYASLVQVDGADSLTVVDSAP